MFSSFSTFAAAASSKSAKISRSISASSRDPAVFPAPSSHFSLHHSIRAVGPNRGGVPTLTPRRSSATSSAIVRPNPSLDLNLHCTHRHDATQHASRSLRSSTGHRALAASAAIARRSAFLAEPSSSSSLHEHSP